jgi:D-alanyl-D-alanine carboxypeptidase
LRPKDRPAAVARLTAAPDSLEQLRRDLAAIFTVPRIDHAFWACPCDRSRTTSPVQPQRGAHADARVESEADHERRRGRSLGWDYRYTTKIYATGPSVGGDLDGDLVIVSNGDPTINPRHPDRWGAFDAWAKAALREGHPPRQRSADRRRQRVRGAGLALAGRGTISCSATAPP